MRSNRPRNTRPELALRQELHARGLRYRIHRAPHSDVRSTADVVFARARLAVYVDGCFWHGCPEHAVAPKRNGDFWRTKLQANVDRDRRNETQLTACGWTVLRIWEHEDASAAADKVEATLRALHAGTA